MAKVGNPFRKKFSAFDYIGQKSASNATIAERKYSWKHYKSLICYILPKNVAAGGWNVEGYLKILASQKLHLG